MFFPFQTKPKTTYYTDYRYENQNIKNNKNEEMGNNFLSLQTKIHSFLTEDLKMKTSKQIRETQ